MGKVTNEFLFIKTCTENETEPSPACLKLALAREELMHDPNILT